MPSDSLTKHFHASSFLLSPFLYLLSYGRDLHSHSTDRIAEAQRQKALCPRSPSYELAELGFVLGSSWGGRAAGYVKAPRSRGCCLLKTEIPKFRTYTWFGDSSPVKEVQATTAVQVQAPTTLFPLCSSTFSPLRPREHPISNKAQLFLYILSAARYWARLCGQYGEGQDLSPGAACLARLTRSAHFGDGTRYSNVLSPPINSWSQPHPFNWLEQVSCCVS